MIPMRAASIYGLLHRVRPGYRVVAWCGARTKVHWSWNSSPTETITCEACIIAESSGVPGTVQDGKHVGERAAALREEERAAAMAVITEEAGRRRVVADRLERLSRAVADYNLVAKTAYRINLVCRFAEATDDEIVAEAERFETETTRLRAFLGLVTGT